MKTLSDLKRRLTKLRNQGIRKLAGPDELLKITIYGANGLVYHDKPPAPVASVRTRDFAVLRGNNFSFLDFGKAHEWTFTDTTAIRVDPNGQKVTIEFIKPDQS